MPSHYFKHARVRPNTYWPFREGSGNPAALIGSRTITLGAGGGWGGSTYLTHNGAESTASDTGLPSGSAARSITGWLYLPSLSASEQYFFRYGRDTTNNAYAIGKRSDHKLVITEYGSGWIGATALSATTWYHFAFVWTGSTQLIYLDGVSESLTVSGTPSVSTVLEHARIGGLGSDWDGTGTLRLNCYLDDMSIYARALPAEEVDYLYRLGRIANT